MTSKFSNGNQNLSHPAPPVSTDVILRNVTNEINRRLNDGQNYSKTLDYVFNSIEMLIPYDRIGIALLEGTNDETRLTLKWARSKIPMEHLEVNYSTRIQSSSLGKIIDEGKPRIIGDLIKYMTDHPDSESTRQIVLDGIRSSLTCPLRANGKPIGVVFFSSRYPHRYTDAHIDVFLEIANALSVIVEIGLLKEAFDLHRNQTRNLGTILHDLKAPLSVIQGFAELSLDEPWFQKIDPEGKQVFRIFIRNSKHMFELLNELLELSQINQKQDKLECDAILLKDFVEEMTHFGRAVAAPKDIKFFSAIAPGTPSIVFLDRYKIRRVLENLFSNAAKYSGRGSRVEFKVYPKDEFICFSVHDNGQGIPHEEHYKLFQEFGKTSARPTEGESSTGLGLAIVKKLVEQHHGNVEVESEVGKGTTFSFCLPNTPPP